MKALGCALISLPFVAYAAAVWWAEGLLYLIGIVAGTAAIFGLFLVGFYLVARG